MTIRCLITKIYELGACFLYFSYVLVQNGEGGGVLFASHPFYLLDPPLQFVSYQDDIVKVILMHNNSLFCIFSVIYIINNYKTKK